MNLRDELFKNQDLSYRAFYTKLVPGYDENKVIGVRIPVLRKIAKKAFSENAENRCEYYEEIMVFGLTLGMKKCTAEEHIKDLEAFVPLIDNWAVCDTCCAAFKFTDKYRTELYPFILSYLGKSEYKTRFAIIMLMDYYLTAEYIDEILEILCSVKSDEYYVNMAAAWAVQSAFVKFRDETMMLLTANRLTAEIQNKAIQKIRDSLRVSKEDKDIVNQLKIRL